LVYRRQRHDDDGPADPEALAGRYAAEGYAPDPYDPAERPDLPARSGGRWDIGAMAEDFLDDLLPEDLDWRRLVHNYPKTALAAACLGGFLVGRSHGRALVVAAKGLAVAELTRVAEEAVGTFAGE
jgi:hypothetical protein